MNTDEYWAKIAELNQQGKTYPRAASKDWQDVVDCFQQMNTALINVFESLRPAMIKASQAMSELGFVLWTNFEPLHRLMAYHRFKIWMPDWLAYWLAYHLPRSLIGDMDIIWEDIKELDPISEDKT